MKHVALIDSFKPIVVVVFLPGWRLVRVIVTKKIIVIGEQLVDLGQLSLL